MAASQVLKFSLIPLFFLFLQHEIRYVASWDSKLGTEESYSHSRLDSADTSNDSRSLAGDSVPYNSKFGKMVQWVELVSTHTSFTCPSLAEMSLSKALWRRASLRPIIRGCVTILTNNGLNGLSLKLWPWASSSQLQAYSARMRCSLLIKFFISHI